ncbi:MAG: hypothetical protein ACT4PZ_15405 [Panacagrimonas sp.]
MKLKQVMVAALLLAPPLAAADNATPPVSFKTDLQPLLNAQCVFCHVTGAENGGLNLGRRDAYASLMAPSTEAPMARVTPGDAAKSYLIHKLKDTQLSVGGSGNRMPMTDPPRPLEPAQLELFVRWVESGAPNN